MKNIGIYQNTQTSIDMPMIVWVKKEPAIDLSLVLIVGLLIAFMLSSHNLRRIK